MKPFPTAQLEAKILRFLLEQGEPRDFAEIRFDGGFDKFGRARIWVAIRSLIGAGWVSYAYRMEVTAYEGFQQTMSYPVFWVNRSDVAGSAEPLPPVKVVKQDWWRAYMASLNGKGVGR